jgi:cytochrome oxidase assembly protein ShyY1
VYRFLLSGRWLGFAALVAVVVGVCVRLGMWQFDRLDERQADNERIEANLAAAPAPVDTVVASGDGPTEADEWRRVTATGRYDADHQVLLTEQSRDVGPGVDVLTPLVLPSGTAVLVDRGWLATGGPSERPDPPAPPTGPVSVTGWLRLDSDADDWATVPDDESSVRAVDSDRIAPTLPYAVLPGWIALTEQRPAAATGLAPPEEPDLGQGPHFFYGLQWWFFGVLAVVGYGWFAWAEAHPRPQRDRPADRRSVSSSAST